MDSKLMILLTIIVITGLVFWFMNRNMSGVQSAQGLTFTEMHEKNPGKVIDVRTDWEHAAGHLALTDAQYDWNSGELQRKIMSYDKDETIYLYCRSGNRSGQAQAFMRQQGFKNVHNIGGYSRLKRDGAEVVE